MLASLRCEPLPPCGPQKPSLSRLTQFFRHNQCANKYSLHHKTQKNQNTGLPSHRNNNVPTPPKNKATFGILAQGGFTKQLPLQSNSPPQTQLSSHDGVAFPHHPHLQHQTTPPIHTVYCITDLCMRSTMLFSDWAEAVVWVTTAMFCSVMQATCSTLPAIMVMARSCSAAASMAAFSAKRLVCPAMSRITPVMLEISCDYEPKRSQLQ